MASEWRIGTYRFFGCLTSFASAIKGIQNTAVDKSPALDPEGEITELTRGTTVNVLEIVQMPEVNRVRGRIEAPAGWISLRGLGEDSRKQWVQALGHLIFLPQHTVTCAGW